MKICVLVLLLSSYAHANIARSSISTVGVSLYGVFLTSDPSCQVGLIESVPLTRVSKTTNFVTSPILGAGPVPNRVSCVILVIANQVQVGWPAQVFAAPDNVCSLGGTLSVHPCISTNISWPTTITSSAQTAGLSLSSTCGAAPSGVEVIPIYMSVNSSCTGNSVIDQQISGCSVAGKTTSAVTKAPTQINSSSSGAKIQIVPISGRLIFSVDPDQIISGASGTCSAVSSPVFSIHQ